MSDRLSDVATPTSDATPAYPLGSVAPNGISGGSLGSAAADQRNQHGEVESDNTSRTRQPSEDNDDEIPAPDIEPIISEAEQEASIIRSLGSHAGFARTQTVDNICQGQQPTTSSRGTPARKTKYRNFGVLNLPILNSRLFAVVAGLILWSILGTLARLGMQALTAYPGAPISFASAWFNFVGYFCMGFLWEDTVVVFVVSKLGHQDSNVAQSQLASRKRALPLYIGLTTGFCGSFTSFSSLMRDMFIAMSGDLSDSMRDQSHGQAFMSLFAVLITGLALSFIGCYLGRHFARGFAWCLSDGKRWRYTTAFLEAVTPVLGLITWVAAICLAALTSSSWPGHRVVITLSFAPLGCLLRYQLAYLLQNRWAPLPQLGTLAANVLGTAVFAASWITVHMTHTAGHNSTIGCVLLADGIQDGFCGCLTTVSTFVIELSTTGKTLRRGDRYTYGTVSVALSFVIMVVIMAPVRWASDRFVEPIC